MTVEVLNLREAVKKEIKMTLQKDDIKIRVIDSNKLIEAINAGSYEINLSAVMALGAVVGNKEIPKKPLEKRIENGDQTQVFDVCPVCGSPDIDKKCGDYCPKCGQKIDWEENGEDGNHYD